MDGDQPIGIAIEAYNPSIPAQASEAYREFWRLWGASKYFECHEVLELEWRQTRGRQKLFYNGLIHGAVAIYQHRRGNAVGAARQLLRAQIKLETLRPKYFEVDVEALLQIVTVEVSPSLARIGPGERASWPALEAMIRTRVERELSDELAINDAVANG